MTNHELQIGRIDPTAPRYRLLPIRDRTGKVFRASVGDTYAIVEPGDGRLRIPYVEAEGDVRMKHLFDALVDRVGMNKKAARTLRFVSPRPTDGPIADLYDAMNAGRSLDDALRDYTEIEEEWPDDAPEDDDVALCYDVEWDTER